MRWYGESVDLALASVERREKDKKKKEEKERVRSPREILRSTRILLHRYFHAASEYARAGAVRSSFLHVLFYYDRNSAICAMCEQNLGCFEKFAEITDNVFVEPWCP